MFTNPVTLIDETIRHLAEVAELMKEEFDPRIHTHLDDKAKNCRSVYMRIQELAPKLRMARDNQLPQINTYVRQHCIGCEDG